MSDKASNYRGRLFGAEAQHMIPLQVLSDDRVKDGRALLDSIGFNLEWRANKKLLFISDRTRDAILAAPEAVQAVFKNAGFGFNTHDSERGNHTGYNDFVVVALNDLSADAEDKNWDATTRERAVFDFLRFLDDVNTNGLPPVYGTDQGAFLVAWDDFKQLDYGKISDNFAVEAIDQFKNTADSNGGLVAVDDGSQFNSSFRYEEVNKLLAGARDVLSDAEIANAESLFAKATDSGSNSGHATAASISLIHDLQKRSANPVNGIEAVAEYLAAKGYGDMVILSGTDVSAPGSSASFLQGLYSKLLAVFSKINEYRSAFADTLNEFDRSTLGDMAKSVNAMLVGVGGSLVGDAVEFLNVAYEPIKKGLQTNDWSDFSDVVVQYGAAAALSAVVVISAVTAATFVGGPVLAAFVAAGFAAWGVYEAVVNGAELFNKITEDLAELFDKVGERIEEALGDVSKVIGQVNDILRFVFGDEFEAPAFFSTAEGQQLVSQYLVDTYDTSLPSSLTGTDEEEQFFGINNAAVDGAGGNDEIYMGESSGEALGGAGDDILVARNAQFVREGEYLNKQDRDQAARNAALPEDQQVPIDGPIAERDYRLTLDGGSGDDWVIAALGERAVTLGGEGRDWIFNTSYGGEIYGDTIDGLDAEGNPLDHSGRENGDRIWWWKDTIVKDAQPNDSLAFFGFPLIGGKNGLPLMSVGPAGALFGAANTVFTAGNPLYIDFFLPFINYVRDGDDLIVGNVFGLIDLIAGNGSTSGEFENIEGLGLSGMRIENFDFRPRVFAQDFQDESAKGDFGMSFKVTNALFGVMSLLPPIAGSSAFGYFASLADEAITLATASDRIAKALKWSEDTDPLVLDLDGDGIETTRLGTVERGSDVTFDHDGDFFAERTGWLSGDDGFLALDKNANRRIDDISELFGDVGTAGYAELAAYDDNGDGVIDASDLIWSDLLIWRDVDQDGRSSAGELSSLDNLGIISLEASGEELNFTTPQGTELRQKGSFTWESGAVGNVFEAIFEIDAVVTDYLGESGTASWLADVPLEAGGFGRVADLSVAMSNDFAVADAARNAAEQMTVPDLRALRDIAGGVIDTWSVSLELSRELTPVLLNTVDGVVTLQDRAIYAEDEAGGFWQLESGADILGTDGSPVDRATLSDVMAQTVSDGSGWQLEQMWSPQSRALALQHRTESPYLAEVVDGRVVVVDYGFEQADGSWVLASGADVRGIDGTIISAPTREDILAQATIEGQEWRTEEFGFNPYASIEVDTIGVNLIDGQAVDYTVQVTDADGAFFVWARNLDRALELQDKRGTARDFELRNYEVDFDTLDTVGSADDSAFRVELLTPNQFHFATSLTGVDFRPEMLSAEIDDASGVITYAVNGDGPGSISDTEFDSGINAMITLLGEVMPAYVNISRALAVRLAVQGGLKDLARGIEFDAESGLYRPTTDREMAPLFESIFENVPAGEEAARDHLRDWNDILWEIFPEYAPSGEGNLFGGRVAIDQRFVMQMLLPAFENIDIGLDLPAVMNALSLNQDVLIQHLAEDSQVDGTGSIDFLLMSEGDQTFTGGDGADTYFAGKDFGADVIVEVDTGELDDLRFTDVMSSDVVATRDGEDLIITVNGRTDTLRITDQFLGELNDFRGQKQLQSGVDTIVFADGVIWDRFRMAVAVSDPQDTNDSYIGSGSADVLNGGRGNDYLQGGFGGDYYVFRRGDGQDVINDAGTFSFGPREAGLDFIQFTDDISADDLKLVRDGDSDDLLIVLLDEDGNETSDTIKVEGQFGGVAVNLQVFSAIDPNLGIDYIALNLIERFIFADGSSLDFSEVADRVIENARTDGDDAIYGLVNANTLDGGAGDDYLAGAEGSDVYIFGRDYGKDVVEDYDASLKLFGNTPDTLRFVDGLSWTDFDFVRDGNTDTLTIRVSGTEDEVTLVDFLNFIPFVGFTNVIETIEFSDDVSWSSLKLLQHYIDTAATDGGDAIYGFRTDDQLAGGAGDDRLEGGGGNDTYIYKRGDGSDVIFDTIIDRSVAALEVPGTDTLILSDIMSTEVSFSRTSLDLIITINSDGETITLSNQYVRDEGQMNAIENLQFADRTLRFSDLNPEDIDLIGTAGADSLTGSDFAETLDGRAGNDVLIGRDGGDRYLFDVGYGNDVIIDEQVRASWSDRRLVEVAKDDVVVFGDDATRDLVQFTKSGDDLVITISGRTDTLTVRNQFRDLTDGIERFEFVDGTFLSRSDVEELLQIEGGNRGDNVIEGLENTPNTLDGRQGDDILIGGLAGDTYAFGSGYDLDTIQERTDAVGVVDRVVFGNTVFADDLVLRRNENDLIIDLGNGSDVLTISNGLSDARVESFEFADGQTLTIDDIQDRLLTGTEANERLVGSDQRDDRLVGGGGADALEGAGGDDTYVFGFGQGNVSVSDSSGIDTVEFGVGVTRDQIRFEDFNGDLVISLVNSGERIAILGGLDLADTSSHVEFFTFEGGVSLSLADIRREISENTSVSGMNIVDLRQEGAAQNVDPGTGNDLVRMGIDTQLQITNGSGIDTVELPAVAGDATIIFADAVPDDIVVKATGNQGADLTLSNIRTGDQVVLRNIVDGFMPQMQFADGSTLQAADIFAKSASDQATSGNDVIFGSALVDTIAGGLGDDDINGGSGDDTYIFNRGDGRDVITDADGNDTLQINGYRAVEMRVERPVADRNELILGFEGSDDELVLRGVSNGRAIETLTFNDGTAFTYEQLLSMTVGKGTARDDSLIGSGENEVFEGREGDDVIAGGGGDDVYIFRRGDGRDVIADSAASAERNVLELPDHIAAEVKIIRVEGTTSDVILSLGDGDEVLIVGGFTTFSPPLASITFRDGTEWSSEDVVNQYNDSLSDLSSPEIVGTSDANVIESSSADETLLGARGRDTYLFEAGDGRDVVEDPDVNGTLVVSGYTSDQAIISRSNIEGSDILIRFEGSSDEILLKRGLFGFGEVRFDDRTFERYAFQAEIVARQITDGDDVVFGTGFAETVDAGLGDDIILSGGGRDTIRFTRGDGRDTLSSDQPADGDTLRLIDFTPDETILVQHPLDANGYLVTFTTSDDIVLVPAATQLGGTTVREIRFDDGTVWSGADINGRIVPYVDQLGVGNDFFETNNSNDVYVYKNGDGFDTIRDLGYNPATDTGPGFDKVQFEDLLLTDVRFVRSVNDLVVQILPDEARSILEGQLTISFAMSALFGNFQEAIDVFEFADGQTLSINEARNLALANEVTDESDTIKGSWGDDLLTGSAGNDSLLGDRGSDLYQWQRGDEHDQIVEFDGVYERHDVDRLDLATIDISDASFVRTPRGARIDIAPSDSSLDDGGSILLVGMMLDSAGNGTGIEIVSFANGVTVSASEIEAQLLSGASTTGDDVIEGTNSANSLEGGAGDDILIGRRGSDNYVYNRGDGYDRIFEENFSSDVDTLILHNIDPGTVTLKEGYDPGAPAIPDLQIVIAESVDGLGDGGQITVRNSSNASNGRGVERIEFDDGTIWLRNEFPTLIQRDDATAGNDRIEGTEEADELAGLAGDDSLEGRGGSDVYLFNRGDGRDLIFDEGLGQNSPADILRIGGYQDEEIIFERRGLEGDDLIIRFIGTDDRITIIDGLNARRSHTIESFELTDAGTVLSLDDVRDQLLESAATGGSDVVQGSGRDETLTGGAGDDVLKGGAGSDFYIYRAGDGDDRISDLLPPFANFEDQNRVELADYTPDDLVYVTRGGPESLDLVLRFTGERDRLIIENALSAEGDFSEIRFADGTVWSADDMRSKALEGAQTELGDNVYGFDGDDVFRSQAGNDVLLGGQGNDTYQFGKDSGHDRIDDGADAVSVDRV
ncbi:MAG: calcium-binding protein, partial [Pseudomonadota bacterium]